MRRLLVFLKYPDPGQVKTRLAVSIGAEAAAEVARMCVETTLDRLRTFQQETALYIDPPQALNRTRVWLQSVGMTSERVTPEAGRPGRGADWAPPAKQRGMGVGEHIGLPQAAGPAPNVEHCEKNSAWQLRPQCGATLGERLMQATAAAFADGAQRVIVIGSDAPWLSAADILDAFAALDRADVVMGPAEDGGYYLIGLSRHTPALFEGIAWSTSAVYAQTTAIARALDLRLHELPRGYDIDRPEDLDRFLAEEERCRS